MNDRPKVLLTAAAEDAAPAVRLLEREPVSLLHLPLEIYVETDRQVQDGNFDRAIGQAETIIYGNRRNAEFLLRHAKRLDLEKSVQQRVNLAADRFAAQYLEEECIPAVWPESDKPVKTVEFMLRLRRTGPALYPCGAHLQEEIPGLLRELDIPVTEFVLYELEGPTADLLEEYREQVSDYPPDGIICHTRRSVNRIRAAFPDLLQDERIRVIAGDRAVAEKLEDLNRSAEFTAECTWDSILDRVKEIL